MTLLSTGLRLAALIAVVTPLALSSLACASAKAQAAPKATKGQADTVVLSNRIVDINAGINLASMKKAQKKLLEYDAQSHDPVWIRINSPGGSVDAGLILIDTMKAVQSPVHCIVESKAYSMGAIILTFCDKRYGYPHSTYMLHEASYGTMGDDPSNRSKIDFLTSYLDRLHVKIADNLGMDVKKYRARIRDAWWLLADEALAVGLIDRIITDMRFESLPVQKTEAKTTVTYDGRMARPAEAVAIPKRTD
ncbi:MAG: hypothetical protein CSA24_01140 [Deltaproteobacteria bacterium]|nr:MAG: hypothetical protein CSA24_01140 [Deltaproteobacteria bacterium]